MNDTNALPVFFLSFANNDRSPLPSLEEEDKAIYKSLSSAADEQRIQIHRASIAKIDTISSYLNQYQDRVRLFHYGGHANSKQLFLRDQAANAEGIAYQLAQQKSLKLVVLNGCSTHQQVDLLLDLGIPAVIATSTSVGDRSASKFAKQFYEAIMVRKTLKAAFDHAAAHILAETGQKMEIYRHSSPRSSSATEKLAWGLHTKDDAILGEILLPEAKEKGSEKNIVEDIEVESEGNVNIGDKKSNPNEKYDRKNIVKKAKIKAKNFRIGDG